MEPLDPWDPAGPSSRTLRASGPAEVAPAGNPCCMAGGMAGGMA